MTQRFEQIQFNSDNFIINYHIIDEGQEINQFYIYFSCKIDQTIYFKKFSEENTIYDAKCIFSQSLQKQKTSISIFSQDTQLKDDQLIIHFKQQELFIYETKLISFHTRNGQVLKQKVYKACMKVKEMKNDFQREISQQSCKYEFNQSPIDDEDKLLSDITDQTEIVLDVDFQHNLKLINNELKTQQFNVQFYQTEIVSSIFSKFLKGNLQYYYNGQLIDINKSFEDNLIQNNSCVYYGKIYNFTFKFTNNNQIIKIQVKSLNTKIEDAVQPILKENHPQNFQFSCNNRLINLEKTFSQEKIKEGVIQIELKSLIVNIYDKNKIYKYHVLPNLTIEKLNKLINNNQNKWLFKLDNDDILQDNIELSTLKNSNGEVELIYKEYIKQNTILHQYQDDVSIDFFVTQNIKTIENSSLVIPIEWNDQKFFETVKLDQKVEEFLEDFKKQKKLSKIFFFQDGEIIDINKKFEDLRDIEYSFFEIISE
ncbi:unnamed protein product [Paramecium pentaurelia]|uniref:Uncharacterized protein n=1 Tax=Paramecium pentaurelia TaxID=43138 RepID=A0A8S1XJG3_9CILI|nr:unnamed protein product [Paramecium pentaurelia]